MRRMNSLGSAGGGSKAFKYSTVDDYKTAMDAFENEPFSWQNERYIPFNFLLHYTNASFLLLLSELMWLTRMPSVSVCTLLM